MISKPGDLECPRCTAENEVWQHIALLNQFEALLLVPWSGKKISFSASPLISPWGKTTSEKWQSSFGMALIMIKDYYIFMFCSAALSNPSTLSKRDLVGFACQQSPPCFTLPVLVWPAIIAQQKSRRTLDGTRETHKDLFLYPSSGHSDLFGPHIESVH